MPGVPRNKKGYKIAFFISMLQNCARGARAVLYSGRVKGHGGKERAIGPFFSPVAFLTPVTFLIPSHFLSIAASLILAYSFYFTSLMVFSGYYFFLARFCAIALFDKHRLISKRVHSAIVH